MATAAITKRPILSINESPVIKSRWVCGWNPIWYQFGISDLEDQNTKIKIFVYEYGSNLLLGSDSYRPKLSRFLERGLKTIYSYSLNVDISTILRSYLYSAYDVDFENGINCKDNGNSIKIYIKYQVITSDTEGTIVSDESNYLYVTNTAKQPGDAYGQNMAEYVPYGVDGVIKAKFLSNFDEPVYFPGYPFTISFIYSENIIGHELKLLEERKNINEAFVSDLETDLDITQGHFINYLKLQDSYDSNVKYVDISISTGAAVDELYVYVGYVENGYTEAR